MHALSIQGVTHVGGASSRLSLRCLLYTWNSVGNAMLVAHEAITAMPEGTPRTVFAPLRRGKRRVHYGPVGREMDLLGREMDPFSPRQRIPVSLLVASPKVFRQQYVCPFCGISERRVGLAVQYPRSHRSAP